MNTDLQKLQELLNSDAGFREEFKKAAETYEGDKDMKAVFENLIRPLIKEHGLDATFEEFRECTEALTADRKDGLSDDELNQVAGGSQDPGPITFWCIGPPIM